MSYAAYAASVQSESPFKAYSQRAFDCRLQQQQQQSLQKQHLQHQWSCTLGTKLIQPSSSSSSSHRHSFRIKWPLLLAAALVAVVVSVLVVFTPVGWPVPHHAVAASAATIKCRVQQGSNTADSSLCDGSVELEDSAHTHITIWRQAEAAAGSTAAAAHLAGVSLSAGAATAAAGPWEAAYGRRRQQHRKLVRLA